MSRFRFKIVGFPFGSLDLWSRVAFHVVLGPVDTLFEFPVFLFQHLGSHIGKLMLVALGFLPV